MLPMILRAFAITQHSISIGPVWLYCQVHKILLYILTGSIKFAIHTRHITLANICSHQLKQ